MEKQKKNNSKKLTILYVLKILKEGSNKEHPISQSIIAKTINLLGVKCERKTISRDIDALIAFGYDIVKLSGGGCYLNNTEFIKDDVELLLQGISSLNIDIDRKIELSKKIKKLINVNERNIY